MDEVCSLVVVESKGVVAHDGCRVVDVVPDEVLKGVIVSE